MKKETFNLLGEMTDKEAADLVKVAITKTAEEYVKEKMLEVKHDWISRGLEDSYERIKIMNLKEVKHLRFMKKSIKGLGGINNLSFMDKFNKRKEFEAAMSFETEEELAELAMSIVTNSFNEIMGLVKE